MIVAHIAGIPIEETALSFGPVIAAGGGIATMRLRERLGRRRSRQGQAGSTEVSPPPSRPAAGRSTRG